MNTKHVDWDRRFLELCDHVAQWSKDPRTKVGACVVDNRKRVVSMGYNGFPRGINDSQERYSDRDTKLLFVAHAERNALDNAPLMVDGYTLYSTLEPCFECTKSIIQKGITKVVTYGPPNLDGRFKWDITRTMLQEAGIPVVYVEKP
jgi:dCMP deaminase